MDETEIELRHAKSLDRLNHSDRLARQRASDNEIQRARRQTEASIADRESMELQHELNIENRSLDHQFNRAEDARDLRRLSAETALRRRDDFIREQWRSDERLQDLEASILGKVADAKLTKRQAAFDHDNAMQAKDADQQNALELEAVKNELDKDNFEFKERLKARLTSEGVQSDREKAQATIRKLKEEGKI